MEEIKGNCIDKFIEKKVNRKICEILNNRLNIRLRKKERSETNDYFNTLCYEQDFNSIIKIRDEAQLIVDNCNKFLERISEQYSKLN